MRATDASILATIVMLTLAGCGAERQPPDAFHEADGSLNYAGMVRDEENYTKMREPEMFVPRPFPTQLIKIAVADKVPDPDNARIVELHGRHNGPNVDNFDFCGRAVHMNSVGYIDRPTFFFGFYNVSNPERPYAVVTQTGNLAVQTCTNRVYANPGAATQLPGVVPNPHRAASLDVKQ